MKKIIQNSFYQLLAIYAILIFLVSLSYISKYTLHFEILALVLGIFGIAVILKAKENKETKLNKKIHCSLFILAVIFIILFRIIPYLNNSIPLGYDTGLYKYGIEHGLENKDNWILQGGMEPGFLYLMEIFKLFFSTQFILTYLLIFFCIILGIAVYLTSREYFNENIAIISILIYSLSSIQFLTFSYMYYKNIIGLSLALFSLYFLRKSENAENNIYLFSFVIMAGFLASIHRPTFYIFGLSYFFYALVSPWQWQNKKYNFKLLGNNIIYGTLILLIASLFYSGEFSQAILIMFSPVLQGFLQPGESPGTFINFFQYQFSSLVYLPFAILGFFCLIKNRKFNPIFIWTLINAVIVYFQFFFFNRFIIHLDIMLIILASLGFYTIIQNKKKLGITILIILLFSSFLITFNQSREAKLLINENELETIKYMQNTEENAFVMSTSSVYSTWLQGYTNRKVIAPGLFDYNKHNKAQWQEFWTSSDLSYFKQFMNEYNAPLYIFIGQQQKDNLAQFPECFSLIYSIENNKVYKYTCF